MKLIFILLMLLPVSAHAEGGMWGAVLNNPVYSIYKEPKKIVAVYPEYTEKQKEDAQKKWDRIDFWRLNYGRWWWHRF